jgi:predicted Zn finger-like uncharacterized protein
MKLADGIRKHGFSKWYERELLQSHAHLVLTFLCAIGLFAAFEGLGRFRSLSDQLTNIVAIGCSAVIGVWALRRYLYLLLHAETLAHQAQCPHCKTYARFTLLAEDRATEAVDVQCKKCEHRWHIESS